MLVESPDGSQVLLGGSHKVPAHMRTCLSGFVDQCESIEEVRSLQQSAAARGRGGPDRGAPTILSIDT